MFIFFFFNDTATTEIYTLSLHDALPICVSWAMRRCSPSGRAAIVRMLWSRSASLISRTLMSLAMATSIRSEEHTSELQSQSNLVCRLLLEKKNNRTSDTHSSLQRHTAIY